MVSPPDPPPVPDAAAGVVAAIYDELHGLARALMAGQRPDHTLQPTALVHEAILRLWDGPALSGAAGRGYLFTAAAQTMREVLVEHARRHAAAKRGGGWRRHPLDAVLHCCSVPADELPALHEALHILAHLHPRAAQVVVLRFFGGFDEAETAGELGVSPATVQRDFQFARAWLRKHLREDAAE